uniref:Uncharacterized protein n=1 Tax=Larimichthys crocea TaxID=215358 RepID=A0A0F8AF19_LARCR
MKGNPGSGRPLRLSHKDCHSKGTGGCCVVRTADGAQSTVQLLEVELISESLLDEALLSTPPPSNMAQSELMLLLQPLWIIRTQLILLNTNTFLTASS